MSQKNTTENQGFFLPLACHIFVVVKKLGWYHPGSLQTTLRERRYWSRESKNLYI